MADETWEEQLLSWIEKNVGVPRSIFASTDEDDDWLFIIKMHAVLEAALNHLLLTRMANPNLSDIVARLETSDQKKGKLAFAKAYGLLNDRQIQFVKYMSETRNMAVHDIKNFGMALPELMKTADRQRRDNWRKALTSWLDEPVQSELMDAALQNPRLSIHNSCTAILICCLHAQRIRECFQKRLDEIEKELDDPSQSTPRE